MVVTLLAPTINKFAHTFSHHQHKICIGEKSTHIHQVDLDCEFFKHHISKTFTTNLFAFNLFSEKEIHTKIISPYFFLSDYQSLHFSLRGPPQISLV